MSQLALALVNSAPILIAQPRRVALTDPEAQLQAETRFAILKLAIDFKVDPQRFGLLRLKDGTPVTSFSKMTEYVAETSGVSVRTLKYWLAQFNAGGLPALADRQRRDKNTSRFFAQYPKAAWLVAYLYLECRTSCRVAHEAIVRDPALVDVDEENLPTYETVRAWLKSMPPSLVVYARLGRKAYRERMAPYLSRQFTDVYANQVWVGDHMIHDVECANDCFDDAEWGAPIRIRFSAMLDYRSRMFTGASWCWEGSSRAIAACMRRGILNHGTPEHIYVDNGKDYRKVARGALPGYLAESPLAPTGWWRAELDSIAASGFLARLGIAVTHCIPHHPQSKCVERAFRTVHERFDRCWPTYTSGSPSTRPDSTDLAMMQHRRLMKRGLVSESKHPLASKFVLACLAWLEEYADTPHEGEGMDGGTPRQVFEANLNPDQKPTPEHSVLAMLMADRETRSVCECAVTLKNRRYVPVDQAGWASMHAMNERSVLVVFDPVDLDNVAALDEDGNLVAWLEAETLTRFAPYDKRTQQQIADSMATRRRLEKGNREALTVITRAARSNGAQSPLEAMVGRLQLPAGESGDDIITQRRPRLAPAEKPQPPATPAEAARQLLEALK